MNFYFYTNIFLFALYSILNIFYMSWNIRNQLSFRIWALKYGCKSPHTHPVSALPTKHNLIPPGMIYVRQVRYDLQLLLWMASVWKYLTIDSLVRKKTFAFLCPGNCSLNTQRIELTYSAFIYMMKLNGLMDWTHIALKRCFSTAGRL